MCSNPLVRTQQVGRSVERREAAVFTSWLEILERVIGTFSTEYYLGLVNCTGLDHSESSNFVDCTQGFQNVLNRASATGKVL